MLRFADAFLTLVHLAIICFNLFGWIWRRTRKVHLAGIVLTAGSWFVLGYWYGWGYCPVTDWQWDIKRRLGETRLPGSFIKYYADKLTGLDLSPVLVDRVTGILFAAAAAVSIYLNIAGRKRRTQV